MSFPPEELKHQPIDAKEGLLKLSIFKNILDVAKVDYQSKEALNKIKPFTSEQENDKVIGMYLILRN